MTDEVAMENIGNLAFDVDEELEQSNMTRQELLDVTEKSYNGLVDKIIERSMAGADDHEFARELFDSMQSDGYIYINKRKAASIAQAFYKATKTIARLEDRIGSLENHRDYLYGRIEEFENESLIDFIKRRYL